jgi:hypothetical protein
MNFFEDIKIGQRRELGSFTFTAEAIKKLAAVIDRQRVHERREGRRSSVRRIRRVRLACRIGLHETSGGGGQRLARRRLRARSRPEGAFAGIS